MTLSIITFLITGLIAAAIGLGSYLVRPVRDAEVLLPDHDALADAQLADAGAAAVAPATAD